MRAGQPSQTARRTAAYRAIHQTLEGGTIFRDPYASRILDAATLKPMRLFIAARSRYSEDALGASVARGVRQVVVLGAGLDTFSLRNPFAGQGVRVFEVDFPATQQWKRERLREAALALPGWLTFAPVDFERQSIAEGLAQSGFRVDQPAFFQWLGVVPYLTRQAISDTLDFIAGIPRAEFVFDYAEPFENYPPDRRAHIMGVAETAAARGEPWLSQFDPAELSKLLYDKGFRLVEDLGLAELSDRYYGALKAGIPIGPGAHVVRAQR